MYIVNKIKFICTLCKNIEKSWSNAHFSTCF